MKNIKVKRVEFGKFVFDPERRELLRWDRSVPLSGKAFQLLEALIERQPNALSKSELHDRLWPDTFVVEANLSNLIGEVRRALDEDAGHPRFVHTVHRFGYAFRDDSPIPEGGNPDGVLYRLHWAGGHALLADGEHIIGRDPNVAVPLDSPSVSRRHARITISGGQATFEDLRSKNGSSIAGRHIDAPVVLTEGDVILVGVVELKFLRFLPVGSTETVHPR